MFKPFLYLAFSIALLSFSAKSKTYFFESDNFEKAELADSFLNFRIKSTKVGLFSSTVAGFVKSFKAQADFTPNKKSLKGITLTFNPKDMDTGNQDRDEKLHNFCFEAEKYPIVSIHIPSKINLGETLRKVPALMTVRGKTKNIFLDLRIVKSNGKVTAFGSSRLSLSALEIPDPSITVASVDDKIHVDFNIVLEKL